MTLDPFFNRSSCLTQVEFQANCTWDVIMYCHAVVMVTRDDVALIPVSFVSYVQSVTIVSELSLIDCVVLLLMKQYFFAVAGASFTSLPTRSCSLVSQGEKTSVKYGFVLSVITVFISPSLSDFSSSILLVWIYRIHVNYYPFNASLLSGHRSSYGSYLDFHLKRSEISYSESHYFVSSYCCRVFRSVVRVR